MTPTMEEIGIAYVVTTSHVELCKGLTLSQLKKALDQIENPHQCGVMDAFHRHFVNNKLNFKGLREYLDWLETEQDPWELGQLLNVAEGKKSFLEIGSMFGGTLYRVAERLAPNSTVVSVDVEMKEFPHLPKATLNEHAEKIRALGHACTLIDTDSRSLETIDRVKKFGKFDFGFIDGDHSYEGVKADWENYGPLCGVVGFHDIAGTDEGCVRLWNEIKKDWPHLEFINRNGKRPLGIGVIYRG